MGIAAGGRLRQQIVKDQDIYRRRRWNAAATSMISVQVLNSVAFEAITGMVTPPTPITTKFGTGRPGTALMFDVNGRAVEPG